MSAKELAGAAASGGVRNPSRLPFLALLRYGLFQLPLSLVALPIYVFVPKFYSDHLGLSLGLIGALLLIVRLVDAVSDPVFGWWVDHSRSDRGRKWLRGYRHYIAVAVPLLGVGYVALFHPPLLLQGVGAASAGWLAISLLVVYAGYSLATIAHQSWGADLSIVATERARITGTREACGLIGVLAAAALSQTAGADWLSMLFVGFLIGSAVLLLGWSPHPPIHASAPQTGSFFTNVSSTFNVPLANRRFVSLLVVYLANGISSALPATLVLFWIRDFLGLEKMTPLFLSVYFLTGAFAMPLWVFISRRLGQARAWLLGMILSVLIFMWTYALGPGDFIGYLSICVIGGIVLGADLSLPPALLSAVIEEAGQRGKREGSYFGLWSFATKLNLALAAGISLPLLGFLGYEPTRLDGAGTHSLAFVYCIVPCVLKLLAALLLWRSSFFRGERLARRSRS